MMLPNKEIGPMKMLTPFVATLLAERFSVVEGQKKPVAEVLLPQTGIELSTKK